MQRPDREARRCGKLADCAWHPALHAKSSRYVRFKRVGALALTTPGGLVGVGVDNAFTGAALDRAGDARRRDAEWLRAQLEHRAARAVVAGDQGLRVADGRLD